MQVGDLVKYCNPAPCDAGRVFLVLEIIDHRKEHAANLWVKLDDHKFHAPSTDLEVISASR